MTLFPAPVPAFSRALSPAFFGRDPVAVARELLGCLIVRVYPEGAATLRIVETEAYDCPRDPSCHVIERLPGASEALHGPPGRYYFHRSYEHALLNVVCMPVGHDATILVRAAEVVSGLELLRARRAVKRDPDLSNGPAKLVQALGICPELAGLEIDQPGCYFVPGEPLPPERLSVTARVGLRRGAELPWRFLETGNPWVSPGKPSA
ncbi:DNA-3-methyladenine glycosylase [Deinococcus sp.]|uniref:DNA-3-methyladenine glycosylase n=1 Tax=Deinococcus sp. TaxID=47478 RepID=UPI003C7E2998